MSERPLLSRLGSDDRSGFTAFPSAGTFVRRVHRGVRGNISTLFIFMLLGFYCASSMVYNTGYTVGARIHAQTAADAAAYNAAMWTSRCVNNITGANMLIARHVMAFVISFSHLLAWPQVPIHWASWLKDLASVPFVGAALAAAGAAYIALVEFPPWFFIWFERGFLNVLIDFLPNMVGFMDRIEDLSKYEKAWVAATPEAIDADRKKLEQYYGCKIRLTRPQQPSNSDENKANKAGKILPPLVQGSGLTLWPVVQMRFLLTDNNWPSYGKYSTINRGKGNPSWNSQWPLWCLVWSMAFGYGNQWKHYVLPTQIAIFEQGPNSLKDWQPFSVVATVTDQPKTKGLLSNLMASKLFSTPISPGDNLIAYAQAETYNGIDQVLPFLPYPYRVWTTAGWQWQPRLHKGDQLANALQYDKTLQNEWKKISVKQNNYASLKYVAIH